MDEKSTKFNKDTVREDDLFKPETIAQYFFGDDQGQLPTSLDLREVDLIYNDYIRVMTIMYEKLKNTYNTFVNRFLSEEQRKENKIGPEMARFTLPTDNQDSVPVDAKSSAQP